MTGFTFDAKAALERARKCRALSTLPTLPTFAVGSAPTVGTVGTVGPSCDLKPENVRDELARDFFEERAAIRHFDGGQDAAEAERAAWLEARRAAGITALDEWRRAADDPHNPDNWADSPTDRNLT